MLRCLLFFILFFASSLSLGSLYFEPIVGYGKGSANTTVLSGGTTASSNEVYVSPSLGFKFGYFAEYVYLALDARYSMVNFMGGSSNSSPALTNMGLSLGWDWNLPIRTFFGFDFRADSNIYKARTTGVGQRIGIGYYLNLKTLVSLEFVNFKTSGTAGTADIEVGGSYTLLTFSFPIEFTYPETSWKDKVRQ